ncbi:MAG: MFS transporter [Candidatus Dormibacteria bacterium]
MKAAGKQGAVLEDTALVAAPTPGDGNPPPTPAGGRGGFLGAALSLWDLRKTPYGLAPAVLLALVGFFQIFDTQAFNIAGPNIAQDLHINLVQIIGVLVVVNYVAIMATLFAGWLGDRRSRVRMLGISTIVSGLAAMASSRVPNEGLLTAARATDEAGTAGESVPLYSLISDYYPIEARARGISVYSTVERVGRVLAILVVAVAITRFGWRSVFFVIGVPLALSGVVVLAVLREPVRGYFERKALGATEEEARTQDEPMSFGEAWRSTWSVRTLRRLFLADLIGGCADAPYGVLLPFYLAEVYGLDAQTRGLILLPAALAALAGGVIGGGIVDRLSSTVPSRVLRLTSAFGVLSAISTVLVAGKLPIAVFIVFNAVVFFVSALVRPAVFSIYSQVIPPNIRTQGLQVFGLASLPGLAIFLPFFGGIAQNYGYEVAFYGMVPIILLSSLVQLTAADFFEIDRRNALVAATAGLLFRRRQKAGGQKLLSCTQLEVGYDGVQVLFGVDFEVEQGEIVAILGTNGAGKSTLLRAISGTTEASGGTTLLDGREITHMPPHEIARRGVVHMPGGRGVFPELSVRENLLMATWLLEPGVDVEQSLARVHDLFPVLKERGDQAAEALSGGEQQMLALGQALMARPRLLMIDELSLGLSPGVVGQLLDVVRKINEEGTTVLVVEQSVNVALTLAHRAVFMEKGEVKFDGATRELMQRPDILRAVYVKGTTGSSGAVVSASAAARRQQELDAAGNVLEVRQVVKSFGGIRALDGVSLNLRQGEVLGIIGPNGSGKTTLLDVISGYQKPDSGTIMYEGVDVTAMAPHERARRKLIRRFQDARLFPSLTVYESILVAQDQRLEVRNTLLNAAGLPMARRAERRARVRADRLIELLELGAYRDKFVRELSTGLRRITDLAFVLAAEPKVLLLDEPSSGVAQSESEALAPLLRRVKYETGCSILIIEHDIPLITAVSDELVALDLGRQVRRGTAEDVLNDPHVIEAYLGGNEAAVRRSGSLG